MCNNKKNDLMNFISEHENIIVTIKKRFYFFDAFFKEMDNTIGIGNKYKIRNDIVYRMLGDSFDMLVIDIASLSKAMYTKGGFFNKLKNFIPFIRPIKPEKVTAPIGFVDGDITEKERLRIEREVDQYAQILISNNVKDAILELFPNADSKIPIKITHQNIDQLKKDFITKSNKIISDRDNNRAHRYQNSDRTVPKVEFQEIRTFFNYLEDILNKVRLICDLSTFAYNNVNFASSECVSKDILDMIIWGDIKTVNKKFELSNFQQYREARDKFYSTNPFHKK